MRIDLRKSIAKRRLIETDRSFDTKAELVMSWAIGTMFTGLLFGIPVFMYYRLSIKSTLETDYPTYFFAALLTTGCICLYGLLSRDRLFKIKLTSDTETNKKILKEALKDVFPKNIFLDTGNIWTSKRRYKFMGDSSYNRVTVIYDNSDSFINAEFFGRGLFQSPLHPILYLVKYYKLQSRVNELIGRISYIPKTS
jgi:hypothetical protein